VTLDYTKLLARIVPESDAEDSLKLRTGVVSSVNANGTVDVTISGLTVPNIPRLRGAYLLVGDNVQVISYRGSLLVIGVVGGASGFVSESYRNTAVGPFTAETVIQFVTFNALANVRYEALAVQHYQSDVANDLVQIRLRWIAGATLTTGGTQFQSVDPNCDVAGRGSLATINGTFLSSVTGQMSVGVTAVRQSGSGNVTMSGGSQQINSLIVKSI
jgi:hypothetical protein